MTIVFPSDLRPNRLRFHPDTTAIGGGRPVGGGAERLVQSPGARWAASARWQVWSDVGRDGIGPGADNRVLRWRALVAHLQGRLGLVSIGPFDELGPNALTGGLPMPADLRHADRTLFSDGVGYAVRRVYAEVGAASAAMTQVLRVVMAAPHRPAPGQWFGFGQMYLHLIAHHGVRWVDADPAAGTTTWDLTFSPPLRRAVAVGDIVDFDRPRCVMRAAKPDSGALDLEPPIYADVTLELEEIVV